MRGCGLYGVVSGSLRKVSRNSFRRAHSVTPNVKSYTHLEDGWPAGDAALAVWGPAFARSRLNVLLIYYKRFSAQLSLRAPERVIMNMCDIHVVYPLWILG